MAPDEDRELAALRRLSAADKLNVMHRLWQQAWALKAAGIRWQHPDWSPEQVHARVMEIFRRAGT